MSGAPGRPRSEAADEAIRGAVLALYAEHGFAGLTVDAVAERAGVSKATIYRRYCSKSELVFDALEGMTVEDLPTPDTGSLRGDLEALARGLASVLELPDRRALVCNLLAEMGRYPDIAAAQRRFVAGRLDRLRDVVARARVRGDAEAAGIRAEGVEALADRLFGPIFFRVLWRGRKVDDTFVPTVVAAALRE